ncbi:uncharacterized protein [Dysidea avara]|uniref:uncharacterized protein isoform X2 n=1 Tax=Dysidea avara TaxID=196820 RepID=UPI003322C360
MMADDDDSSSNIEYDSSSQSEETLSIWGNSDNDLQSMSSSSSDNSIPSTSTNSNYVSIISSPLSSFSGISNSLESFPSTYNSVSETSNDLQSPPNPVDNLSQSEERSDVDCSLSTNHSDSSCVTDYDKDVTNGKDHSKSLEEAARISEYDSNKMLELAQEHPQKRTLQRRKVLQQSDGKKSEKGLLKSSKSENVALKSTNTSTFRTRQERHVTNRINFSKGFPGTDLNKNGTSVDEEEPSSLISLLEELGGPFEELFSSTTTEEIVSSDITVKSDVEVTLSKLKVLLSEGLVSQDDGDIQTLEDLLAAKTKSLDLEHKDPDVVLIDKSPLRSICDVDFSKYESDMSKRVHSLIGLRLGGTFKQHLVVTNDQIVMNATMNFDLLEYVPGGLAAFVDDGDNDGGEAGVDEEFTGNLFVSNEENLSDSEHLSIASHATDAEYDHVFLADDSSSQTHHGSTPELLHEEPNGLPHLETVSGLYYEEPNINVTTMQDEMIGVVDLSEGVSCCNEQLKLAAASTNEYQQHQGYQEEESSQSHLEPLASWEPTVVLNLEIVCEEETSNDHTTRLSIPRQSLPLEFLRNDTLVCTTTNLSASGFLVDGNCIVEVVQTPTTSSSDYQLYARLCGQFAIMVFAKGHDFSKAELHAELALAYNTAKLQNLITGIALPLIDDVLNNAPAIVRVSTLSTLLPGIAAQILSYHMQVDTVYAPNPVDLIRTHQRELFHGIPLQVSNQEDGPPLQTAPDWSGHDAPRTQLVWRNYPLSVNESDKDNEGNDCSSPHPATPGHYFNSGSASPNDSNEQFIRYQQKSQDCQKPELCEELQLQGIPESLDCVLVNWLTDCQCEQQTTIDMGELVIPTLLSQAGCDPDPGDPGWTKVCDRVDSSSSFGTVSVALMQPPPPGAIVSDFEITCEAVQETVCDEPVFTSSYFDEREERFHLI